ncbi:MAG: hypothetical protein HY365_00850 [Candidatus Aenigmarchaeota archaeon]|nr:hypothetical protein [Candidatus Aenigmarchaeota archaeon]
MKGFMRILEAFIASIILFASITYFFSITNYSFWDSATLRTTAEDALRSLYMSGMLNQSIYNGDTAPIKSALSRFLPGTAEYAMYVSGVPPPSLRIHCVCATNEADAIQSRLGGIFMYKGRAVTILMSADPDATKVDKAANLILFTDTASMQGNKPLMEQWLSSGRRIMLFSNLAETDFLSDVDNILGGVFGLAWQSGTGSGGTAGFYSDVVPSPSYTVKKYFTHSSAYDENEKFSFTADPDLNRVAVDINSIVTSTEGYSLVKASKGSAWFAGYDGDSVDDDGAVINDDVNKLFRAALMFAEGERYAIKNAAPPSRQPYSVATLTGSVDGDPYIMTILIWSVFY